MTPTEFAEAVKSQIPGIKQYEIESSVAQLTFVFLTGYISEQGRLWIKVPISHGLVNDIETVDMTVKAVVEMVRYTLERAVVPVEHSARAE